MAYTTNYNGESGVVINANIQHIFHELRELWLARCTTLGFLGNSTIFDHARNYSAKLSVS